MEWGGSGVGVVWAGEGWGGVRRLSQKVWHARVWYSSEEYNIVECAVEDSDSTSQYGTPPYCKVEYEIL